VDKPAPKQPGASTTTAEVAAPTAGDPLAGEIDELFDALKASDPAPAASPVTPVAPAGEKPAVEMPLTQVSPAPVEKVEVQRAAASAAVDAELERELAAAEAERAALVRAKPIQSTQVDLLSDVGDDRELPVVLKPLAWLSAPLDAFPDEVRETLGKIAILTLVNAVAVLAYVMLFRRHH
jgi:hypothetical protein